MKSLVIKRSILVNGRHTSISIEDSFWLTMKDIAKACGTSLSNLVGSIDASRAPGSNLSSAIRVHVLGFVRDLAHAIPAGGDARDAGTQSARTAASSPEPIRQFAALSADNARPDQGLDGRLPVETR